MSEKPADSLPLVANDGSAADPASALLSQEVEFIAPLTFDVISGIGVAVLLANWTRTNLSDSQYADAASGQLHYLLDIAPRSPGGAISHRNDEVQLWCGQSFI